jgi:subtilase family serine protease
MLATIAALLAMTVAAPCRGASPAITNVVTSQTSDGALTTYRLDVTVANLGRAGQPSNELQSVNIFLDGQKKGEKGIPPLRPGAEYTFPYTVQRSAEANNGTSAVRFRLVQHQGPALCPTGTTSRRVVI